MEPNIQSISSNISNVRQDVFPLDKWTITTRKGIIMQSKCTCRSSEVSDQSSSESIQVTNSVTTEQTDSDKDLDKEPIELCDICRYHRFLPNLLSMPDMLFNNNLFRLEHISGVGIEFNPLDALKEVRKTQDPLQVGIAEDWQTNRPHAKKISRPFDWTFTTAYCGTILSAIKKSTSSRQQLNALQPNQQETSQELPKTTHTMPELFPQTSLANSVTPHVDLHHMSDAMHTSEADRLTLRFEETDERIDIKKLKQRDEILFYDDITLYEDELADHGTAQYSVKVRVMPSSMFILARYYLRIDGAFARINDTRIFHELNQPYILREYTSKEAKLTNLNLPNSTVINPNFLTIHLPLVHSRYEKLFLP